MSKYRYISLFCGCGGFDLGMSAKAFDCVAAYDINPHVLATFNQNIKNVAIQQDLNQWQSIFFPKADVIIGGPPCQGFSTAGKRVLDDPRNTLFLNAVEIALALRPKVYVAENVAGILAGNHKSHYMDEAVNLFEQNGYQTHIHVINCTDLGMAQMRKRAILIAWNTGTDLNIPGYTVKKKTLQDAIGNIPSEAANHEIEYCMATDQHALVAACIKPGQKLSNVRCADSAVHTWDIPQVFGKTSTREQKVLEAVVKLRRRNRRRTWGDADPVSLKSLKEYLGFNPDAQVRSLLEKNYLKKVGHEIDLQHTYNGKYRRLRWDEPSVTVDTRFGRPLLFLHPTENRAFTVREAARLQTFPDKYVFSGPLNAQYAMVGNAVPPELASYISKMILLQLG